GEVAAVGHRPVASADVECRRGAPARAPHDPDVPDQAVGRIGNPARRGLVGYQATVAADDRQAVRVAHGVAARYLDILVADAPDQRDVGADRDGDVGADEAVDHSLVEIGNVLPGVTGAEPHADGQHGVRTRARPGIGHVDRALVENVDRL